MDLFVETTVFNPELTGKAVRIKGFDVDGEEWDRVFLVKSIVGEKIILTDSNGRIIKLHMENFSSSEDNDLLKMTVLEAI